MSGMMDKAGDRAHERSISISTYASGDDHVIVEGVLIDNRFKEYHLVTGEKRSAGYIHHLVIRLLVSVNDMVLQDVEVEMPATPRDDCRETASSLDAIRGLSVTRGFSLKVRSLFGGTKGCTHLLELLLSMAPAIYQGVWSYKSQKPADLSPGSKDRKRMALMNSVLKDTCYVWREDGPRYKGLVELMKKYQA